MVPDRKTEIAITTNPVIAHDLTLIADTPADMIHAQAGLVLWCETKIALCDAERLEAVGNSERAKAAKWSGEEKRWKRVASRMRAKIEFYTKVKAALAAGYYIVPPFPGRVFAIRTDRSWPRHRTLGRGYDHEQKEETLPLGRGEYVNPFPEVLEHTDRHKDGAGKDVVNHWTTPGRFMPLEFPFGLVRPEILDAANRAMAIKAFDRLSVMPEHRRPDHIVMGDINIPHKPGERVSFFVAWWLNTALL